MAIFYSALVFLATLPILLVLYLECSLLGFLGAAFLVKEGFFLTAAKTLVIKASTVVTLAAFKHLSHLENYLV